MNNVHALAPQIDFKEWMTMGKAPKGPKLRVIVLALDDKGGGARLQELPYLLRWYGDCWCYAGNNGRVFPWHEPRGWLPAPAEWIGGRNPNLRVIES